jgi:mannose/fructose/N-acetylgalactosamine-specific phosphotransferase system component IID
MSANESGLDRVIRLAIAVAAVIGAFAAGAGSVLGIVLFVVAAIMLVTAAVGFCPLYRLFGLSTNKAGARR